MHYLRLEKIDWDLVGEWCMVGMREFVQMGIVMEYKVELVFEGHKVDVVELVEQRILEFEIGCVE